MEDIKDGRDDIGKERRKTVDFLFFFIQLFDCVFDQFDLPAWWS